MLDIGLASCRTCRLGSSVTGSLGLTGENGAPIVLFFSLQARGFA